MHTSRELEGMKITDDMVSQAVELVELDKKELYERLGVSLTVWETVKSLENLQGIYVAVSEDYESTKRTELEPLKPTPYFTDEYLNQFRMSKRQLEENLRLLFLRRDLMEKGRKYFRKFRRKLFQKICVEKEACKWMKEILGDVKLLLSALIPLVGSALGLIVPAIVITVAILIIKWGIIKFCKCPKP